jgi:ANTAR domain
MAPTQSSGGRPDRAAVIASAWERAAEQRRRAARAEVIAVGYEVVRAGESQNLRLLRARMAVLHRTVQTRHLTSAALFELYAKRMAASRGRGQDFRPEFMSAVAAAIGVGSAAATMRGQSPAAVVATASDPIARAAHDLEVALGEGPAITAMTEGVPVSAVGGSLPGRWPLYGPAVGELGVRAVIAVPLRPASTGLGALCGYSREPVLREGVLADARRVAEAVGCTVLLAPGHPASDVDLSGLALFGESDYQAVVHQAAGMVSAQCGCGIDEAEDLLRARAFAGGQPVEQVARAVLRRETRLTL